jgi:hypothetical protein
MELLYEAWIVEFRKKIKLSIDERRRKSAKLALGTTVKLENPVSIDPAEQNSCSPALTPQILPRSEFAADGPAIVETEGRVVAVWTTCRVRDSEHRIAFPNLVIGI